MNNLNINIDSLSPDRQVLFDRLTDLLLSENEKHNLTRITSDEDIRHRHYNDSLAAVDIINRLCVANDCSIIDIGSGAGFPSLPLAIALPEISFTSVEATGKKVLFQRAAADDLNLQNFSAIHFRAEDIAHFPEHRQRYDFAVSRAVAYLSVLLEIALPFVSPGGYFLAWKGKKADEEIANSANAFSMLSAEITEIVPYTLTDPRDDLKIVVIKKTAPTAAKYPRKFGVIKRSPL